MVQKPTLGISLLCFNNERVLEQSLRNLKKLDFGAFSEVKIIIFDPGYPLRSQNAFIRLAHEAGAKLIAIKNHGQTTNIKKTIPYLELYDYVLGWEPDADLNDRAFLTVSLEILSTEPEIGYTVPKHQEWVYDRQGEVRHLTALKEGRIITFQGGFPLTFYRQDAFKKLKTMKASCKGPYGGTEFDIWAAIQPLQGLMLRNFWDKVDQSAYDESYMRWKAETIGRPDQKYFEEVL